MDRNVFVNKYDKDIVKLVTSEFIKINKIIPIYILNNKIVCLTVSLDNVIGIYKIKALLDQDIQLIEAKESIIQNINNLVNTVIDEIEIESNKKKDVFESENMNAPVIKLVESILTDGVARNASDIHIKQNSTNFTVKYRIDGFLKTALVKDKSIFDLVVSRIKILSGLNTTEKRLPQDGKIRKYINDVEYDFRVSTIPTINGEKIVIRILDNVGIEYEMNKLGLTEQKQEIIKSCLSRMEGIILVTGPTGSGKSTTLYTFLKHIIEETNNNQNIITIEDPVEYTLDSITQIQVNEKANLTYPKILKSVLRQDPDIIMIGEIRDEESAQIATRLAITGHLVLSTLHTNDSIGAITRLVNLNIERFLVASSLNMVISQRLVRRICPNCKQEYRVNETQAHILNVYPNTIIYKGIGCSLCNNTGYSGRIGVYEILKVTSEIRKLINENDSIEKIIKEAEKTSELKLQNDCKKLVLEGTTTFEEYLKIYLKETNS